MDEPKNLCIDTGTTTHSEECRALWSWTWDGARCSWSHFDAGQCQLLEGHFGHHRYGLQ